MVTVGNLEVLADASFRGRVALTTMGLNGTEYHFTTKIEVGVLHTRKHLLSLHINYLPLQSSSPHFESISTGVYLSSIKPGHVIGGCLLLPDEITSCRPPFQTPKNARLCMWSTQVLLRMIGFLLAFN